METSDPLSSGSPYATGVLRWPDERPQDENSLAMIVPMPSYQLDFLTDGTISLSFTPYFDAPWPGILDATSLTGMHIPEPMSFTPGLAENLIDCGTEDPITQLQHAPSSLDDLGTSLVGTSIGASPNQTFDTTIGHSGGLQAISDVGFIDGLPNPLGLLLPLEGNALLQTFDLLHPSQPGLDCLQDAGQAFLNDFIFPPTSNSPSLAGAREIARSRTASPSDIISIDLRNDETVSQRQSTRLLSGNGIRGVVHGTIPGAQGEPRNCSETGYPRPKDWEAKKMEIHALYMDCRLDLESVMKIMADRHNFRASIQMYKKRFKKWGWRKYRDAKTCRHGSRSGSTRSARGSRSTVRCSESRNKALLHESDTSQFMEEALLSLGTVIDHYVVPDFRSRNISIFDHFAPLLDDSECCVTIFAAKDCFMLGDRENGARYYRLALVDAKEIFDNLDDRIYECIRLLVNATELLGAHPGYGLRKIISDFYSVVADHQSRHPITLVLRRMLLLLQKSPTRLAQLIVKVDILLIDSLTPLLGRNHRVVVGLRERSLESQRVFGLIRKEQVKLSMDELLADLEHLAIQATTDGKHDDALEINHSSLNSQWLLGSFTTDFLERSARLLDDISVRCCSAGSSSNLGENWELYHIDLYLICIQRMVHYCLYELNDVERAVGYCQQIFDFSHDALQTWSTIQEDRLLGLASHFRDEGRSDISMQLRQLWLDLQTPFDRGGGSGDNTIKGPGRTEGKKRCDSM